MIYEANDKYRATLRATWTADPADTTLQVTSVPDNVPTIVTVGWGTANETVFSVTDKSGDSSANYALTGVTRLKGANVNLPENTAVNCLNHEEFFNQYTELSDDYSYLAQNASSSYMSRQAIMNGNFDVWQRGTTKTNGGSNTGLYETADRWAHYKNTSNPPTNLIVSRGTLDVGDIPNSYYYLRFAPDGAGTQAATDYHWIVQKIEHGTRLLCGNGKKVTVSFWARSDIASKRIGISLNQNYGSGGSPTAMETINGTTKTLTSTWTKFTHTFTTNTLVGKTFGTANDDYLRIVFGYAWGTSEDERFGATDAEALASGYIDIAQVQLCAGEVALPFQPKSYAQELADCQRYCYVKNVGANTIASMGGNADASTRCYPIVQLPVQMRSTITLDSATTAGDWVVTDNSGSYDVTALSINTQSGGLSVQFSATVASGLTVARNYVMAADSGGTRSLYFSSEL